MTNPGESAGKAHVVTSLRNGEQIFHIFGLPGTRSRLGSRARAVVDRAYAEAASNGSAEIDLAEFFAAKAADER